MKSMILTTSNLNSGKSSTKSFSMIPVTKDCPYVSANYYPANVQAHAILHIQSVVRKMETILLPKLDDNGDQIKVKTPRPNGTPFKEERKNVEEFVEYMIYEPEEIKEFVERFAVNSDTFNYQQYI